MIYYGRVGRGAGGSERELHDAALLEAVEVVGVDAGLTEQCDAAGTRDLEDAVLLQHVLQRLHLALLPLHLDHHARWADVHDGAVENGGYALELAALVGLAGHLDEAQLARDVRRARQVHHLLHVHDLVELLDELRDGGGGAGDHHADAAHALAHRGAHRQRHHIVAAASKHSGHEVEDAWLVGHHDGHHVRLEPALQLAHPVLQHLVHGDADVHQAAVLGAHKVAHVVAHRVHVALVIRAVAQHGQLVVGIHAGDLLPVFDAVAPATAHDAVIASQQRDAPRARHL
mmetsp:Transcript_11695/g.21088  ORF Transcript_11695/g.21088 Transcript_11695/m.21088 type:complete len:287 (-) Transcript_11695:921-1781(-)